MAETTYYWLKLQDGFFGSKRIKKLRKLAGGDTYTIIYLKMQLVAMKKGGVLEYTGLEKTFAEELALELDEEPENVAVTISYLLSCGLLEETSNSEYFVPYAVLNTGSESSSTRRVRAHRERKALQCNAEETPVKQLCNTEIEIEKDKEIDKEIEIEGEYTADEPPEAEPPPSRNEVNYTVFQNLYNSICISFPQCTKLSETRKKALRARLNSGYVLADFETLFRKAEASSFLRGKNERNWRADFDWLIKDSSMAKVLSGNYDDHDRQGPQRGGRSETNNPFLEMLNERRGGGDV